MNKTCDLKRQTWLYIPGYLTLSFFIIHQIIFLGQIEAGGFAILFNLVPFIYLIGIPYLIFGWTKRNKITVLLGFILTALFVVQALVFHPSQKSPPENSFTVITHNVAMEQGDTKILEEIILTHKPEIIFLQEPSVEYAEKDLAIFANDNGYDLVFETNGNINGIGILSKTPLDIIAIGPSDDFNPVPYLVAQTTINGESCLLVNVHAHRPWFHRRQTSFLNIPYLTYSDEYRGQDIADVLEVVEETDIEAVIFGGDFNTPPTTVDYRKVASIYQDAFRYSGQGFGFTWPDNSSPTINPPIKIPLFRLDYIFTSQNFDIHKTTILPATGSDHLPLMTIISLPPN